ncbi:Trafficking protein particle complex subunit 3 [Clonorchis sinensis]|uniref:Trafficking protein particle complex subunit 3 n=1 Tax=Clonorchis sinensis TaxID=79923 RepID=A0A419Q6T7_CLOSI|nr:Trafficking protein particle complex subunit 3 [Clonorchis sinensis]
MSVHTDLEAWLIRKAEEMEEAKNTGDTYCGVCGICIVHTHITLVLTVVLLSWRNYSGESTPLFLQVASLAGIHNAGGEQSHQRSMKTSHQRQSSVRAIMLENVKTLAGPLIRGFNIGLRIVEDYLARGNPGRCADFKETAAALVKGFKLFLGITPNVGKFSATGDEFSITLDTNPLTEFVDLPPEHPKLLYSNVLAGAIRGALHNVQLEVDARFVQDQLRGDQVNEIRVKFIRRIKEVVAGED